MSSPYDLLAATEEPDNPFAFTGYIGTVCFLILQLTLILSVIEMIYSKSLNKYSILPYFSLLMNGTIWLFYTLLSKHFTMVISNSTGVFSGMLCCILYTKFYSLYHPETKESSESQSKNPSNTTQALKKNVFVKYFYYYLMMVCLCLLLFLTHQKLILGVIASLSGIAIYYSPLISLRNQFAELMQRAEVIQNYYNYFSIRVKEVESILHSNKEMMTYGTYNNSSGKSSVSDSNANFIEKERIKQHLVKYLTEQYQNTPRKQSDISIYKKFSFSYNQLKSNNDTQTETQINTETLSDSIELNPLSDQTKYLPINFDDEESNIIVNQTAQENEFDDSTISALTTNSYRKSTVKPHQEKLDSTQLQKSLNLPMITPKNTSIGIILTSMVSIISASSWVLYGIFVVNDPVVFLSSSLGIIFSSIQISHLIKIFLLQRRENTKLPWIESQALSRNIIRSELENIYSMIIDTAELSEAIPEHIYIAQPIIESIPDVSSPSTPTSPLTPKLTSPQFVPNLQPLDPNQSFLSLLLNKLIHQDSPDSNFKKDIELEMKMTGNHQPVLFDKNTNNILTTLSTKSSNSSRSSSNSTIVTMNQDVDQRSYQV